MTYRIISVTKTRRPERALLEFTDGFGYDNPADIEILEEVDDEETAKMIFIINYSETEIFETTDHRVTQIQYVMECVDDDGIADGMDFSHIPHGADFPIANASHIYRYNAMDDDWKRED